MLLFRFLFSTLLLLSSSFAVATSNSQHDTRSLLISGTNVSQHPTARQVFESIFVGTPHCGATWIHEDILVTAAHCWSTSFQNGVTSNGRTIRATKQIMYPEYWTARLQGLVAHDIMIVVLERALSSSKPITRNTNPLLPVVDSTVTALGRGQISSSSTKVAPALQYIELKVRSSATCRAVLEQFENVLVTPRFLCAGGGDQDGSSDEDDDNPATTAVAAPSICHGDSGGPLLLYHESLQEYQLAGISSFMYHCDGSTFPNGFTRISSYETWIQGVICKYSAYAGGDCAESEDTSSDAPLRLSITTTYSTDISAPITWVLLVANGLTNTTLAVGPEQIPVPNGRDIQIVSGKAGELSIQPDTTYYLYVVREAVPNLRSDEQQPKLRVQTVTNEQHNLSHSHTLLYWTAPKKEFDVKVLTFHIPSIETLQKPPPKPTLAPTVYSTSDTVFPTIDRQYGTTVFPTTTQDITDDAFGFENNIPTKATTSSSAPTVSAVVSASPGSAPVKTPVSGTTTTIRQNDSSSGGTLIPTSNTNSASAPTTGTDAPVVGPATKVPATPAEIVSSAIIASRWTTGVVLLVLLLDLC